MATPKRSVWDSIQRCDPRYLYALFGAALLTLCFVTVRTPVPIPPSVRSVFDKVETLDSSDFVLIGAFMDAGSIAETGSSFEAVARHLFRRRVPFAVYCRVDAPQGQALAIQSLTPLAREMGAVYGRDYCIWQAAPTNTGAALATMARDFRAFVPKDVNGTPLDQVPMMRGIRNVRDVRMYFSCGYGYDETWIGFVGGTYGTPYAAGAASIWSSQAYPYLDSGQMIGMLPGAAGAAAYERLLDSPASGTQIAGIQSFAALFVVASIVVGNLAMILAQRQAAGADEGSVE